MTSLRVFLFVTFCIGYVSSLPAWLNGGIPGGLTTNYGKQYSAFDGNTLVRNIEGNVTRRQMIRINGYTTLPRNLWCGYAARKELEKQKRKGRVTVQVLPSFTRSNEIETILVPSSMEFVLHMISSGLAMCDSTCNDELRAAEEKCRLEKCGCVWNTNDLDQGMTSYDDYGEPKPLTEDLLEPPTADRTMERGSILSFKDDLSTSERLVTSDRFPTGFTVKKHVVNYLSRPVDFLFLPDGTLLVAHNTGIVQSVDDNGYTRGNKFLDVRDITNDYHDRGLMSIAIPADYSENPYLYFFIVYDHITDPDYYKEPRSARVMKVAPDASGLMEDFETRETILGTVNGFGCGVCEQTDPNCDCIPTEGKSHVGGGLAFTPSGELYVSIGDGGIAWIVPEALRAQQLGVLSGKILKIDQSGKGLPTNPWFDGDVNHRNSKIYAMGSRNVLHLHVSPKNPDNVYMGDTMWRTAEEITVVRRATNCGWPCYEGTVALRQYREDIECQTFADNYVHNEPLVSWDHGPLSASSMIGERAAFLDFPERYRDVLLYGDMAMRFIGMAKLDDEDNLVEDLERIFVAEAVVQMREGPDGCLYYVNVRGQGELRQVCYTPDPNPIQFEHINPADGTVLSASNLVISGTFSKSVEPNTVNNNNVFLTEVNGPVIPTSLSFDFNTRSFTLTPTTPLQGGRQYRIVCRGGENGVLDLDHNVLVNNLAVEFMTSGAGDTTPPTVIKTTPEDLSIGREPTADLRIVFSEAMDAMSFTGNFKIEPATYQQAFGTYVATGAPKTILSSTYLSSSRELVFTAELDFSTLYLVTLFGGRGYISDTSGNELASDYFFSFTTGENPQSISANILTPVVGTEVAVDEVVSFSGEAYTQNGESIPESAFNWQIIVHHCTYGIPSCHSHGEFVITNTRAGSFTAPNHYDRFYYEIYLTITYEGNMVDASRIIETKKVDFTLTSDPPGILLSLSGYTKQTPFTESVVIGSISQISAPLYAGEDNYLQFLEWQDGGARTKELPVPSYNMTFLARYLEQNAPSTPTPVARTPTPTPTPEVVSGTEGIEFVNIPTRIPTSGAFEIEVQYFALVDRDIFVAISPAAGGSNVDRSTFEAAAGSYVRKINFIMSAVLQADVNYFLKVDIRERGGNWTTKIMKDKVTVMAESIDPQPAPLVDNAIISDPPAIIPLTGSFEVDVQFGTAIARDLSVLIRCPDPREFITEEIVTVSGSGSQKVIINYSKNLIEGRQYQIRVDLREIGGDFSTRVSRNDYATTAAVAAVHVTDQIVEFTKPIEPFPLQSSVDMAVSYTAVSERTLHVTLHSYATGKWIGGNSISSVPPTNAPSTVTLPVTVSRLDRISAGEQIIVRAVLRPVGVKMNINHVEHTLWA